jgi:hypothetical protein
MNTRLLLAALAATALLAACGGSEEPAASPASGGSQESANRKALLDFARCMRENGVDMPDPQFDGGKVTMTQRGGPGSDPEKMRTAEKACAKYRDAVKPPEGAPSGEQQAEFKKQALENARCMREHGIDMPDPQFSENGGVRMNLGKGIDPESQKFKDAQKACRGTLPQGPSTTTAGGGE